MKLRSIPPANRRPGLLRQLSSMRAATHVGLVFVGSQTGRSADQSTDDEFTPRVITPDKAEHDLRGAIAAALTRKAEFWQAELATWQEELGPDAVSKLQMEKLRWTEH